MKKTIKNAGWFDVDRDGLRDLVAGRDYGFVANELLQNAFDEDVRRVTISVSKIRSGETTIVVTDDSPSGFLRLDHAWTLFASSKKKVDPTKRGRFNLGEKYVLAIANRAMIVTTTGNVIFNSKGRTVGTDHRTEVGSRVEVVVPVTAEQRDEILRAVRRILVPEGVELVLDDGTGPTILPGRIPIAHAKTTLPTVLDSGDGVLRSTRRATNVRIFETREGLEGWIYELGIPVAKTGDLYDYDVRQKIPLGTDRETVSPAFLREVRAAALHETRHRLTPEDAISDWVADALQSKDVSTDAVNAMMTARFGAKRVSYDPSDQEANRIAVAQGYTVVHGGSLPAETWANVRRAADLPPAGRVTPSPKPYSPDGTALKYLTEDRISDGMRIVERLAKTIASAVLSGRTICVLFACDPTWPFAATYGPGGDLTLNVGRLGRDWFSAGNLEAIIDLLIHEFGHEYTSNHLSEDYYRALTKIGARLALAVALDRISLAF